MVDHARAARMAKRIQEIVASAIERERAVFTLRSGMESMAQTAPEHIDRGEDCQPRANVFSTTHETAVSAALSLPSRPCSPREPRRRSPEFGGVTKSPFPYAASNTKAT